MSFSELAKELMSLARDERDAELVALQERVKELEGALAKAANGLEAVAERTWDKRHRAECLRACNVASDMASGYCEKARAALSPTPAPGSAQTKE